MSAKRPEILILVGTRPEAIKLAPVIHALHNHKFLDSRVCLSGQHKQIARQMLADFEIKPDIEFSIPRSIGNLNQLAASFIHQYDIYLRKRRPDLIVVQGDTTSAMLGALCGFYEKIPLAHIEAGLRSFNLQQPFPEELNRRIISMATTLNFCPTAISLANLKREGLASTNSYIVGNTCIDALFWTLQYQKAKALFRPNTRGILVTSHRRENWNEGLDELCAALRQIASRYMDVDIIYPVHPNPIVQKKVKRLLGKTKRIRLVEPLSYVTFCHTMKAATLIVTDSGGIQEEALALGKPTLVIREVTERPEVLIGGTVRLVGTRTDNIIKFMCKLLDDQIFYKESSKAYFPFGKGNAGKKIIKWIENFLRKSKQPI